MTVHEETQSTASDSDSDSATSSIYSGINSLTLNQIKNIDVEGSFGSKIDTLARHILWIRENDPGAKSVIFSQYKDFLDVLSRAFSKFKIGFASIDRKNGVEKFKKDPSVSISSNLLTRHGLQTNQTPDRVLLPACQSPFLRPQPRQRHACFPLRTADQHSSGAASHRSRSPHWAISPHNGVDVPGGGHGRESHLRHLSHKEAHSYRTVRRERRDGEPGRR